ncbi:MAG TPA: hypothetical protein VGH38_00010 [Bryobacteraceae bacterium]
MKPAVSTVVIVAATFGWLAALFALEPFDHANAGLDRAFGALPAWTQVENMYRDPTIQEVSRGDHPLESFRILEETWAAHPGARRIILMGNSQTQSTSLSPGEPPPSEPEKTYTDLIADRYRESGSHKVFYRLAAGALSYQEMLWYATWLVRKPEIKPDVLLVQLNYQNFANGGIRAGMLEMLSDAPFRQAVELLARSNRPDSDAFAEALHRDQASQHGRDAKGPDAPAPGTPPGDRLETAFRTELAGLPGFDRRDELKRSFTYMLLRCRTYVLHLNSASRRSLGGTLIAQSRAALEDLLDLCSRSGIRVVLFQAPTNPLVPLYKTAEDDRSYHAYTASVAQRFGVTTLDFEHSIPAAYWGRELNVPDPLHLGREGHRLLARLILTGLEQNGL